MKFENEITYLIQKLNQIDNTRKAKGLSSRFTQGEKRRSVRLTYLINEQARLKSEQDAANRARVRAWLLYLKKINFCGIMMQEFPMHNKLMGNSYL